MKSTPAGRVGDFGPLTAVWLVELFAPGLDCSLGWYVSSVDDNGVGSYKTTALPEGARRFTREEAERVAARLFSKQGVWRAVEHGFYGG